jgi:hypothetical protein
MMTSFFKPAPQGSTHAKLSSDYTKSMQARQEEANESNKAKVASTDEHTESHVHALNADKTEETKKRFASEISDGVTSASDPKRAGFANGAKASDSLTMATGATENGDVRIEGNVDDHNNNPSPDNGIPGAGKKNSPRKKASPKKTSGGQKPLAGGKKNGAAPVQRTLNSFFKVNAKPQPGEQKAA